MVTTPATPIATTLVFGAPLSWQLEAELLHFLLLCHPRPSLPTLTCTLSHSQHLLLSQTLQSVLFTVSSFKAAIDINSILLLLSFNMALFIKFTTAHLFQSLPSIYQTSVTLLSCFQNQFVHYPTSHSIHNNN